MRDELNIDSMSGIWIGCEGRLSNHVPWDDLWRELDSDNETLRKCRVVAPTPGLLHPGGCRGNVTIFHSGLSWRRRNIGRYKLHTRVPKRLLANLYSSTVLMFIYLRCTGDSFPGGKALLKISHLAFHLKRFSFEKKIDWFIFSGITIFGGRWETGKSLPRTGAGPRTSS
jgi:hypothetical protein